MYSSIDIVANVLTIFAFSLVNATRSLNLIGEQYLSECVCVCDVKTLKNKFMGETEKGIVGFGVTLQERAAACNLAATTGAHLP